ncbi:hypothetical protein [Rhodococcus sp. (in: high G+C Gram-positive bacteria)]|uniref:hypothetical protein n=1 Tax=Rhodococcus sp. TaxID=1831 RepID=UPI00389071B3
MSATPPTEFRDRNGLGNTALIAGIVAALTAFVPIVGDFVSIPAGLLAVVCGWIGLVRIEKGLATNYVETVVGTVLGTGALFVVFIVFAATHSSG